MRTLYFEHFKLHVSKCRIGELDQNIAGLDQLCIKITNNARGPEKRAICPQFAVLPAVRGFARSSRFCPQFAVLPAVRGFARSTRDTLCFQI
jgi:hypothetical protein